MGGILGLLSGPITNLVNGVGSIIDKISGGSPEEKIAAKQAILDLQTEFQSKLVDADLAFAEQQKSVLVAEIQSQSWLARNWRPILMLTFTFIVAWNYIVVPIFGLHAAEIPADMWVLMKIGVGGYVIGRSVEKTAPAVASAITGSNNGAPSADLGGH